MSSKRLVWLITGTSTGFGRYLTLEALKRGDNVIATARNLSKIQELQDAGASILELDVTSPLEALRAIAEKAVKCYGRIDVVVNNAGYIAVGALEENTPEESIHQFNVNVFGALNVARAFLPYMRSRKSGTVVWLGSLCGWESLPNAGLYVATKYAVRGLSETLHDEISSLGLRSLYIEPGYFRTAFLNDGHRATYKPRIQDYTEMTKRANAALEAYNNNQPGDPKKLASVIVDLVHGEGVAHGRVIPPGLPLGSDAFKVVKEAITKHDTVLNEWEAVIKSTDL